MGCLLNPQSQCAARLHIFDRGYRVGRNCLYDPRDLCKKEPDIEIPKAKNSCSETTILYNPYVTLDNPVAHITYSDET